MVRALFLLALIIAAASAFVPPTSNTLSSPAFSRVVAPKMSTFDNFADVATSSIAQSSELLASQAGDFGGYLFPVVGLAALGAVILVLAPPLADE